MKNEDPIEILSQLTDIVYESDWKKTIDTLVRTWRKAFIVDNLAVYLLDDQDKTLNAIYARSLGRGRRSEADASWGESIANQVIHSFEPLQSIPANPTSEDRISSPYILGFPLKLLNNSGVLVMIRFGGPKFTKKQRHQAKIFAELVTSILERKSHRERLSQLEDVRIKTQLQDDFIATISHELNTPLGFIKGYTTSLLREDVNWNEETIREFLMIIDDEADQLIRLIRQMLDSARLKAGKFQMTIQSIQLESVIRELIERYQTHELVAEIHFEADGENLIEADPNLLVQVFGNLIDNSRKYAPGSPMRISTQKKDNLIEIKFIDNGPGIPEEHLPFLFERFYKVPGHYEIRGTGLGLFICREVIHAHHGTISVESSPHEGTEFMIKLPLFQDINKRFSLPEGRTK